MSPFKKPSRDLKRADPHARRESLVSRLFYVSSLVLIAAAALTLLYAHAPDARLARASHAQKPDEEKKPPAEIPLPKKNQAPVPVARPKLVTLCPGRPMQVRLNVRPPFRGRWDAEGGVGKITKVNVEEGAAVWDLSGVEPGTYTAVFKLAVETLAYVPAPLRVGVTVRECPKPTPTPTPEPTPKPTPTPEPSPTPFPTHTPTQSPTPFQVLTPTPTPIQTPRGNDNVVAGGHTPTPTAPTPSPTPSPSASPTPSPDASPSPDATNANSSGASTPTGTASPIPVPGVDMSARRTWLAPSLFALLVAALVLAAYLFGGVSFLKSGGAAVVPLDNSPDEAHTTDSDEMGQKDAEVAGLETADGVLVGGMKGESDEVQCTVFAPLKASPGDSFLVQLFAHLATQIMQVANMAADADAEAKQRDSVELDKPIERGQELVFELTMRGLDVQEPTTMRLVWNGKPKSVKFDVSVPDDCQPKSVTGTVDVYHLNVPIGNLRFKLDIVPRGEVEAAAERSSFPEQKFTRYRYAFISYASEDRAEVLRRVQVLPLVRIDYFQDITSLDPGDRWAKELYKEIDKSDVFFLFWSKAARDSEWVEKEVLYAMERKHGDEESAPDIKPVMLEGPPPVEPPERLRSLHFNDKILYFISVEDSLRAAREKENQPARGANENGV
jgi:hypothetical protein